MGLFKWVMRALCGVSLCFPKFVLCSECQHVLKRIVVIVASMQAGGIVSLAVVLLYMFQEKIVGSGKSCQ